MPNYSNSSSSKPPAGGKKPYKSTPSSSARGGATGAPKKRWTGDDRAARTGDRSTGAARPARDDRRPDWSPRDSKPSYQDRQAQDRGARPSYGDRKPARPSYGDRPAVERPSNGDRPGRTERPAYNSDRPARPSYGDRNDRPARSNDRPSYNSDRPARSNDRTAYNDRAPRTDRPAYNSDRPARTERPSYNSDRPARSDDRPSYNSDRPARSNDRPSYNDRAPRTDRPAYNSDRPARTERPSYNSDRPARSNDRPSYNSDRPARSNDRPSYNDRAPRTDRPAYNSDRPARSNDRPAYSDRTERPSYSSARTERPSYDRAPKRDFDDRAPKRESDYYTARTTTGPVEDVVLERLEAAVITATDVEGVSFADLGLGSNIVRQLASMGAEAPFAIQAATIPDVLSGRDVLGRGKTGSGKTIAFGAPLVERLMENNGGKDRQMGRKPRALILAPTRELAMQIDRTVQPIARSVGLFTTTIVGGVPQFKQVSALQRGVDIVIATPGRVEDLIEQGRLDLSNVIVTVLDEADHMCDLGFLEPVQRILQETSKGGQKLLFSATLDKGVATLVKQFLVDPAVHEVAGEDQASSTIDHRVLLIEQRDKREIIQELARGEGKTLIFTRTRAFAEEMSDYLEDAGIPATSLHGDLNQSRRTRNLQLLTSGRVNVLVATDVAARGIHVDDISLVIQADAPEEYKTYLHRSGRTGRAGKVGTVVTLINRNRRRKMDELLGRAEIDARSDFAAPGDAMLAELAAL
ncbi:superfamily II DNA/RNA helicase [Salinibacterium sp. CAN_S4]|uniref:DEAD/DEAH box helicase n=1 Tax=Salinibacterium sp. CAN_S4 TaxID=2787727 RepID=UPI0018EF8646